MFEGAFDYPIRERIWQVMERYKVSMLFAAPTVLRTLMKWGEGTSRGFDLSSLEKVFTGGERLMAEPWQWFLSNVCQRQCLLLNGWGQTETGSALFSSVLSPSAQLKPGSVGIATPGTEVKIIDLEGNECEEGDLVLTKPWPSMLRGIYKDEKRYEESYWRKLGRDYFYFTGDRARKDREGDFWILGRSDDVINVSAHRIGLGEIEAAMISHPSVAEVAFIDVFHEIKGQGLLGFVVLKEKDKGGYPLEKELKEHLVEKIGAFARPEKILIVADLPKTRSGKVMKSVLKNIVEGKMMGDLSTIADISVIEMIQNQCDRMFLPRSSMDFSLENPSI
jgi:acetyl-CoA synthetase